MYSNENESFFIFNLSYNRPENALNFNLGQVYPDPDRAHSISFECNRDNNLIYMRILFNIWLIYALNCHNASDGSI